MAVTSSTVEILPDRLYMHLSDDDIGPVLPHTTYLNVSPDLLVYINYFDDFGPLHLGHTFRFCAVLSDQLTAAKTAHVQLHVLVSSTDIHAQVNMVCLLACWGVLYNRQAPESAVQPFRHMNLPSFHDATDEACPFQVAVVDVVRGFHRALSLQARKKDYVQSMLLLPKQSCIYTCRQSFNVADYLHYEKVEHGDLNWISPKFIAFAGPQDVATPDATTHPPGFFIPMFMKANVTLVVRLNEALYDPSPFRSAGIAHLDLGFPDGANPPSAILRRFLAACEATPGAVAVHCKAGLGRTGTVIGCYMIKHDGFKAKDAIGWLRYDGGHKRPTNLKDLSVIACVARAVSTAEASPSHPYMEILRPKRFLPDENHHPVNDDPVTAPAPKKRALGGSGATFPSPSTTLPYAPRSSCTQYPAMQPSTRLPKISPVVLVLKKRPLDSISEAAPAPVPSVSATKSAVSHQQPPQPRQQPHQPPSHPMLQSEKLQSVLRGLVHVAQCSDGCSNKLCQSTTAFVTKVRVHLTSQPSSHDRSSCGACKLWTVIADEHRKDCLDPLCPIPLCKRTLYM
ncbi:hypothetical protein DYB30_012342 [Aphanomyces astaci]|uniref:protein-tyrosine-phosphatase n=1 Tax=Aphanomyces astaci TaxID=112090 RepID=A0A397CDM0_APHAT|nr:hypothetical protein DYB30_012342 [Aphanomyces astaci]